MRFFLILATVLGLMACEGPPPDTPPEAIANGLVGKSYYNKVDNYHYDGGVAYGFAE